METDKAPHYTDTEAYIAYWGRAYYEGTDAMGWGDVADLTHATQIGIFGFCTCEDNEGNENPYDDCPKEA